MVDKSLTTKKNVAVKRKVVAEANDTVDDVNSVRARAQIADVRDAEAARRTEH